MQVEMQLLKELQELDKEKQALDQQRSKSVRELDELQAEVDHLQGMIDSLSGEIAEIEAQKSELNLALTQEQDNINRSEGRLPQIKTQKEYVAVLKEVDTAKKLAKEIQDQIDAKDQELSTLGSDKAEKDEELAGLTEKADAAKQEIDATLAELDGKLDEMVKQRESLLKQLPAGLRSRYNLLLKRRDGIAVVEARGGACLGCHMHLPPQLYNSLFVAEDVQSCPHCNRLLFVVQQG